MPVLLNRNGMFQALLEELRDRDNLIIVCSARHSFHSLKDPCQTPLTNVDCRAVLQNIGNMSQIAVQSHKQDNDPR